MAAYRQLRELDASWERLLGALLSGWSNLIDDVGVVREAAREVQGLRRAPRKARLLAKLSGFASDKGDLSLARELYSRAIRASDADTLLGRALRVEGSNLGLRLEDFSLLEKPKGEEDDDLVWPPLDRGATGGQRQERGGPGHGRPIWWCLASHNEDGHNSHR